MGYRGALDYPLKLKQYGYAFKILFMAMWLVECLFQIHETLDLLQENCSLNKKHKRMKSNIELEKELNYFFEVRSLCKLWFSMPANVISMI